MSRCCPSRHLTALQHGHPDRQKAQPYSATGTIRQRRDGPRPVGPRPPGEQGTRIASGPRTAPETIGIGDGAIDPLRRRRPEVGPHRAPTRSTRDDPPVASRQPRSPAPTRRRRMPHHPTPASPWSPVGMPRGRPPGAQHATAAIRVRGIHWRLPSRAFPRNTFASVGRRPNVPGRPIAGRVAPIAPRSTTWRRDPGGEVAMKAPDRSAEECGELRHRGRVEQIPGATSAHAFVQVGRGAGRQYADASTGEGRIAAWPTRTAPQRQRTIEIRPRRGHPTAGDANDARLASPVRDRALLTHAGAPAPSPLRATNRTLKWSSE